jgi:hypothetical protein
MNWERRAAATAVFLLLMLMLLGNILGEPNVGWHSKRGWAWFHYHYGWPLQYYARTINPTEQIEPESELPPAQPARMTNRWVLNQTTVAYFSWSRLGINVGILSFLIATLLVVWRRSRRPFQMRIGTLLLWMLLAAAIAASEPLYPISLAVPLGVAIPLLWLAIIVYCLMGGRKAALQRQQ